MSTRPRPEDYPAPFKGGEQNDRNDTRVGETSHDGEQQGHGEAGETAGSDADKRRDEKDESR